LSANGDSSRLKSTQQIWLWILTLKRCAKSRAANRALNPENTQVFVQIFCSFLAAMALIYTFTPIGKTGTQGDKTRLATVRAQRYGVRKLRDMNFEFKSGKFTQAL